MKHHTGHEDARNVGPNMEPASFEFTHPTATSVCVAGTFNQWDAETRPMHPMGGGRWLWETGLPSGTYQYRLVVDGEWMADPLAKETVPNPFGGRNSVLKVANSREAAGRVRARNLPMNTTKKPAAQKL